MERLQKTKQNKLHFLPPLTFDWVAVQNLTSSEDITGQEGEALAIPE